MKIILNIFMGKILIQAIISRLNFNIINVEFLQYDYSLLHLSLIFNKPLKHYNKNKCEM